VQGISRAMYSNPLCHGAYPVTEILQDDKLKQQWCAPARLDAFALLACAERRALTRLQLLASTQMLCAQVLRGEGHGGPHHQHAYLAA